MLVSESGHILIGNAGGNLAPGSVFFEDRVLVAGNYTIAVFPKWGTESDERSEAGGEHKKLLLDLYLPRSAPKCSFRRVSYRQGMLSLG